MRKKKRGFTLIELLVVISIILILVSFVVPQIGGAREKARVAKCLNNLRVMGSALLTYADDNSGQFPGNPSALYPNYVGDHKVFDCPSTAAAATVAGGVVSSTDYLYAPGQTDEAGSGVPVVADAAGNHSTGQNVLFATGAVRFVPTADIGAGDGQVDVAGCTDVIA